jgi:hypothetical protein
MPLSALANRLHRAGARPVAQPYLRSRKPIKLLSHLKVRTPDLFLSCPLKCEAVGRCEAPPPTVFNLTSTHPHLSQQGGHFVPR